MAVLTLVLLFCMINVHEIGHTVAAWLAGDRGASYGLYETYPNGSFNCIGCNHYDPALLSFWGKFFVTVAGVLATQAVFAAALVFIRLTRRRPSLGVLIVGFVVFVIGDALFQTIQALTAPIASQTGLTNVDFADALYLLHRHWGLSVELLKVALAGATAAYVLAIAGQLSHGPDSIRPAPYGREHAQGHHCQPFRVIALPAEAVTQPVPDHARASDVIAALSAAVPSGCATDQRV